MLRSVQCCLSFLQKQLVSSDTDQDKKKVFLLGLTYFFIIGSYSILRSLKTSIFLGLVGAEWKPYSRLMTIITLVPTMLFHAKIIDYLKRHQSVYFFLLFYAALSGFFACILAHPVYGLANTLTSPLRLVGWAFDIFMDMYPALIVSTFWGFVNFISTPQFATHSYPGIVTFSRISGIIMPLLAMYFMDFSSMSTALSIPLLILLSTVLLLGASYAIYSYNSFFSHETAHLEISKNSPEQHQKKSSKKPSILDGLKLMIQEPYVFGIFILVFGFEVINAIFDYQMQVLMSLDLQNNVGAMSRFMLTYTACWQGLSLFFSLFGTGQLLKKIGVRPCLILVPLLVIGLTFLLVLSPHLWTIFIIMVIMRAIHYGFSHPIREMLYVPTIPSIQFKSKALIDSFGRTFSKTISSGVSAATMLHPYYYLFLQSGFALFIALIWLSAAMALGKAYTVTIAEKRIVGKKEQDAA